jgi:hypothetical protein
MRNTSRGVNTVDLRVELTRGLQVVPERLLDDDPPPATTLAVVGHLGARHLFQHGRERGRWDGEVERRVALDAVTVLELDELRGEGVERRVVVEGAGQEAQRVGDAPPDVLAELGAGMLLRSFAGELLELTRRPVATGEAEQYESRRQQAAVAEVVDSGDQLLAGEVAGHPEHDEGAGVGDAGEPTVPGVAQRVVVRDHGVRRRQTP